MARQDPKKVREEVEKQKDEYYGDETPTGSATDSEPENTEEILEDMIGNEPDDEKPFSIADEVEKDEESR